MSSKIRQISAEKILDKESDWRNVLKDMRTKFYKTNSMLNMKRDTPNMKTTSQLELNLTDNIFILNYFKENVTKFEGIKRKLPDGYTPKIKIQVKELKNQ